MNRHPSEAHRAEPARLDRARAAAAELRVLPAQDRRHGGAVLGLDRQARAAEAAVRLGDLWRRRLDPRAHAAHGVAHQGRHRRRCRGAPDLRRRHARRGRRGRRAATRTPASAASWRCAAIRRRASASRSRRIPRATATPPISSPASASSAISTSRSPPIPRSIRRAPTGTPTSTISSASSMPAPTAPSPRCSSTTTTTSRFVDRARAAGITAPIVPGHPADPQLQADLGLCREVRRLDPGLARRALRRARGRPRDPRAGRLRGRGRAGARARRRGRHRVPLLHPQPLQPRPRAGPPARRPAGLMDALARSASTVRSRSSPAGRTGSARLRPRCSRQRAPRSRFSTSPRRRSAISHWSRM